MAAGYNLKEGKYDPAYKSAKDIKNVLTLFYGKTDRNKKASTYKYAMLKAILDSLDSASDVTYIIRFDVLFEHFARIYWTLVFKHGIPQKPNAIRGGKTLAEIIVDRVAEKYDIQEGTEYSDLPASAQSSLRAQMKGQCSEYVFGALYAETYEAIYSFHRSKTEGWIKLNPAAYAYFSKHNTSVQSDNYTAWASYYVNVLKVDGTVSGYKTLLKNELGRRSTTESNKKRVPNKPTATKKQTTNKRIELKQSRSNKTIGKDVTLSRKIWQVLNKYPDIGLYIAQVADQTGASRTDVSEILDNAAWCKKLGSRYYFVQVDNVDIISDGMFADDDIADEELEFTADDISPERLALLDDPEQLIKVLKREKCVEPHNQLATDAIHDKVDSDISAGDDTKQKRWEREEVVILVTEYFRTKALPQDEIDEAHRKISTFLKHREYQITGAVPPETFRNYAGIHMQSSRIRCLDPDTKYSGMQGTKLQKEIVQEYLQDPNKMMAEAEQIYHMYGGRPE